MILCHYLRIRFRSLPQHVRIGCLIWIEAHGRFVFWKESNVRPAIVGKPCCLLVLHMRLRHRIWVVRLQLIDRFFIQLLSLAGGRSLDLVFNYSLANQELLDTLGASFRKRLVGVVGTALIRITRKRTALRRDRTLGIL